PRSLARKEASPSPIKAAFFLLKSASCRKNPKFNKTYIYKSPNNKYQKFSNAYTYSFMVKNENPAPSRLIICDAAAKE
ncbi:19484_t:CDS:2, partial [Gigaspora rosea]